MNLHFISVCCCTNQHTDEPQVYFVVFVEPGPMIIDTIAREEYHDVARQVDQDEESQCDGHQPLIGIVIQNIMLNIIHVPNPDPHNKMYIKRQKEKPPPIDVYVQNQD